MATDDGRIDLDELELFDATQRLRLLHPARRRDGELAGYAFPRSVRESIAKIDLRRLEPPAGAKFEVFVKEPREDFSALGVTFQRRGATVEVHSTGVTNGAGRYGSRDPASSVPDPHVVSAIVARASA
jgi:hypothetical protein